MQHATTLCNTLQQTATVCNTLWHTVTHMAASCYNLLQHATTLCNTPQQTATVCNTQHALPHTTRTTPKCLSLWQRGITTVSQTGLYFWWNLMGKTMIDWDPHTNWTLCNHTCCTKNICFPSTLPLYMVLLMEYEEGNHSWTPTQRKPFIATRSVPRLFVSD